MKAWFPFSILLMVTYLTPIYGTSSSSQDLKNHQIMAFVTESTGNSSTFSASDAITCAQHFLDRISGGQLSLGDAVSTDGEDEVAQVHQLIMRTSTGGINCSLFWTSASHEGKEVKLRTKRSLGSTLQPLLSALVTTLDNTGLRRRRSLSETRNKRSPEPILGILNGLLGGGGGGRGRRSLLDEN